MTNKNDNLTAESNKNIALFLSALKEAVRQYPTYFYVTGPLEQLDSMWDMQPSFNRLESLMLENEATQTFVAAVWSFFRPISLGRASFGESTRAMSQWQKQILAQMMLHDPVSSESGSPQPVLSPDTC
ncbi:MAG: hypothetical protein R3208_00480 [Ketobacteraceae bacterium]|nr:hypothetical protein [Ketobacteraceae bacterium]